MMQIMFMIKSSTLLYCTCVIDNAVVDGLMPVTTLDQGN